MLLSADSLVTSMGNHVLRILWNRIRRLRVPFAIQLKETIRQNGTLLFGGSIYNVFKLLVELGRPDKTDTLKKIMICHFGISIMVT